MKTSHQNENQSTPTPTHAITRRSFIKRTTSAALVAMLAIGAFQNEARAQQGGASSSMVLKVIYTLKNNPTIFHGPNPPPAGQSAIPTQDKCTKIVTESGPGTPNATGPTYAPIPTQTAAGNLMTYTVNGNTLTITYGTGTVTKTVTQIIGGN